MSEPQEAGDLLDRAERAAEAGDLATADELLRSAARSQEERLGPLHPVLANTLNNLAIIAERTGRPSEAEAFYRRAVAIASASLPPEHPMVVASRQNLEDFCRAHGLSIDVPVAIAPTADPVAVLDVAADENRAEAVSTPPALRAGDGATSVEPAPASSAAAPSVPRQPPPSIPRPPAPSLPRQAAPQASEPLPVAPTPGSSSRPSAWIAIGAVVLVAAVFLVWRPWSSPDAPTPTPAPAEVVPTPPREAAPARPEPIEPAPPSKGAPRRDDRTVAATKPPAPALMAGDVTVATAQLCRTFSLNGGNWRCELAGDSVAPDRLVFYTRVRSPRNGEVVHRWYRGDALRQSVRLAIQANPTEGYRTYSRQSVDAGDWRVELRSADGSLLHEQRFAVR